MNKPLRVLSVLIYVILLTVGAVHAISNNIYGFLSETYEGINIDAVNPTDPERAYFGVWAYPGYNAVTVVDDTTTFTEGSRSICLTTDENGTGGFYINFGTLNERIDRDFSAYSNGTIEFDLKMDRSQNITYYNDIYMKLEWNSSGAPAQQDDMTLSGYARNSSFWQHVSIPFSAIQCSYYFWPAPYEWKFVNDSRGDDGIKHACVIGFWLEAGKRIWIDNLVWKNNTTGSMSATVKNVSDNSVVPDSKLTWSNVDLGTTRWKACDQYIEIKTDYFDPNWGVQIYTDNMASDANPKYTGIGNPAGMVYVSSTTRTLPLAWRVVDVSTGTMTIKQGYVDGATSYPGRLWVQEISGKYPCFLWMVDKSSGAFSNSADYVTVWDKRGIQHGEATFGGAKSPNYIYIAVDYTGACTPETYATNKIIVELFHD